MAVLGGNGRVDGFRNGDGAQPLRKRGLGVGPCGNRISSTLTDCMPSASCPFLNDC